MKNFPAHMPRARQNEFCPKAKIAMAVKSSERQRPPAKITLKQPTWEEKKP